MSEEIHDTNAKRPTTANVAPTPPAQPAKTRPVSGRNKFRIQRPEGESKLYTHEEDVGGFGSKDSLVRQCLDATNPTKTSWESKSARFHTERPLVDKFYDDDPGVGARRCSMERLVEGSPRKYASDFTATSRWAKPPTKYGSGRHYDTSKVPRSSKGDMETEGAHTARNYRTAFDSQKALSGPADFQHDFHAEHPEYDFGDGPKPNMNQLMEKSSNKVSTIRSPRVNKQTAPDQRAQLQPEYGATKPLVKQVSDSANKVSSMRSILPRFDKSETENSHLDWRAQAKHTVSDGLPGDPVKYAIISTKTPRFTLANPGLGRDFYDWHEKKGAKQNLSAAVKNSAIDYSGTIGSHTPRFKHEPTDSGDNCYDTDHLHKSSLVKGIQQSAIKYSVIKSRVPRFDSPSSKGKLKKLDLDAIYEAELRRVTGQREPAEYYIPDYGSTRGVAQAVSHSKLTYKSCFGSKVRRFEYEKGS